MKVEKNWQLKIAGKIPNVSNYQKNSDMHAS